MIQYLASSFKLITLPFQHKVGKRETYQTPFIFHLRAHENCSFYTIVK